MPNQERLKSSHSFLPATFRLSVLFIVTVGLTLPSLAAAQRPQNFRPDTGSGFKAIKNLGRSIQARTGFNSTAPIETQNFVVYANDEQLARKVSREAERFRKELAIEWLGKELPTWRHKCPIKVSLSNNAGGETSFAFITHNSGPGEPIDWSMKIFGPPDRVLDAVLPHEVTHTIFATHFGRPLPRWADEGACTTVEHESERRKNHRMLLEFLMSQPSRGIPFNQMFTMRNYPHDILPLYAQGYSLARFLIAKKGRRHFVDYVGRGMENESRAHVLRAWDEATLEFYQYKDLSELQVDWLAWVKGGSKEIEPQDEPARKGRLAKAGAAGPEFRNSVYQNQNSLTSDNKVVKASFVEVDSGWSPRNTTANNDTATQSQESFGESNHDLNADWNADWVAANRSTGQNTGQSEGAIVFSKQGNQSTGSWYIDEMNRDQAGQTASATSQSPESPAFSSAYSARVASKNEPLTNRLRKVPADSASPDQRESRLPANWIDDSPTIWR